MVDIAQLVSASDCGSEGRGFESHYPPHKVKPHPYGWGLILSDDGNRKIKCNSPVDCCWPGRVRPLLTLCPRHNGNESHYPPQKKRGYPFGYPLFLCCGLGFEESGQPKGLAKKCPVDTFLARGRIHEKPTALRLECWRLFILYTDYIRIRNESHYPPQKRYQT